MKDFDYYRKAEIPHLRATVYFADLSKLKGVPNEGSAYTTVIGEPDHNMHLNLCVFVQDIKKSKTNSFYPVIIAHELVHVIQYLCEERSMDITEEKEHTAYLMSYLMETMFNASPSTTPE